MEGAGNYFFLLLGFCLQVEQYSRTIGFRIHISRELKLFELKILLSTVKLQTVQFTVHFDNFTMIMILKCTSSHSTIDLKQLNFQGCFR